MMSDKTFTQYKALKKKKKDNIKCFSELAAMVSQIPYLSEVKYFHYDNFCVCVF